MKILLGILAWGFIWSGVFVFAQRLVVFQDFGTWQFWVSTILIVIGVSLNKQR